MHEECAFGSIDGTLVNPSQVLADSADLETGVKDHLNATKDRAATCWACDTCYFRFNEMQDDGSVRSSHSLDYSGTRQLAGDMERSRKLVQAEGLSLCGVSCGTQVTGTYATMRVLTRQTKAVAAYSAHTPHPLPSLSRLSLSLPNNVDKSVIDSTVAPSAQLHDLAGGLAFGVGCRIKCLVASCTLRRSQGLAGWLSRQ